MKFPGAATGIAVGVLCGCAPELPVPELHGMSPDWGWNGEQTEAQIVGKSFFPSVQATGTSDAEVDRTFTAWLEGPEDVRLDSLILRDYEHLDVSVPPGLATGVYDLRLSSPTDVTVWLRDAFTVTSTRAHHLVLDTENVTTQVQDFALFTIQVADPSGGDVPIPLEVEVRARDLGSALVFSETLDGQVPLEDGTGVRGWLSQGGNGHVAFTADAPADGWLEVSPADPASVVETDNHYFAFTPGPAEAIALELIDPEGATAGEPLALRIVLLDEGGNPTTQAYGTVRLSEGCPGGTLDQQVEIANQAATSVVLTRATTPDCPSTEIRVEGTIGGVLISGISDPFELQPGAADALSLGVGAGSVQAGEEWLDVVVAVEDGFGNDVADFQGTPRLWDNLGGLDADAGTGVQQCTPFYEGQSHCDVQLIRAGSEVRLSAEASDGVDPVLGDSDLFEVRPGPPAQLAAAGTTTEVVAGTPFSLDVSVSDAWDNPVELSLGNADTLSFDDGLGSVQCVEDTAASAQGFYPHTCLATAAEASKVIMVALDPASLFAATLPFDVINAEIGRVVVVLNHSGDLVAGEPLGVALQATDGFGNPYTEQTISSLSLLDQTGSLSPSTATLDAAGQASLDVTITQAIAADAVSVHLGTTQLGASVSFAVVAAGLDGFDLQPARTWVWVDEALGFTIQASDAFGNPVSDYDGSVTLTSQGGLGGSTTVASFDAGVGAAEWTPDSVGLQDRLEADDGTVTGSSAAFDVLTQDCSTPPSAALAVGGGADAVLCRTGGATQSTAVSTAGAAAGGAPLAAAHVDLGDGTWTRHSTGSHNHIWTEQGGFVAQALVVDDDACADLAQATVWVADDDGEPAGPVELVVTDASVSAGSSTSGQTTIQVSATDCWGDPASSGGLFVRADLGALTASGSSTVTATGHGQRLTLDSSGAGVLGWSMAGVAHAGTATVHAGVESGAAHGTDSVLVTGDAARPTVYWVDPFGDTEELFDQVQITFSEPMLEDTLDGRISLVDPAGDTLALDTVSLSEDGTVATVELSDTQDGTDGAFGLTVLAGVRDEAGKGLDGDYTGSGAAFALDFGAVGATEQDVSACTPTVSTFRPDGDGSGSGEEAEEVQVALSAASAPTWWELVVQDAQGAEVLVDRASAGSASANFSWNGRATDGLVVENGAYVLTFSALDASWNAGASCTVDALVDNLVRPPEAAE